MAARSARAAWFVGNVYEAVVGVPELVAAADRQGGLIGTGSPVRFYVPVAPVAVGGSATVLVRAWRTGEDRSAVAAAAASLAGAVGLTAYLVASVTGPLMRGTVDDRTASVRLTCWHRANLVRLALLVIADGCLRRVDGVDRGRGQSSCRPSAISKAWVHQRS